MAKKRKRDMIRQIANAIPERRAPEPPLLPSQFVETWAVKIGADGRPVIDPETGKPVLVTDASGNPVPGAQERGTRTETVRNNRGSRSKRRSREHVLERMARLPAGRGRIERRQRDAGLRLYGAWCETQLSPTAIREIFVDGTLDADAITVAQVEAVQRFSALYRHVPSDMRPVVDHVVLSDQPLPRETTAEGRRDRSKGAQLHVALDLLANALGY